MRLPQAKRKRSALRRDTFEPLAEASLNEIAGRESGGKKTNGHVVAGRTPVAAPSTDLVFRGTKKTDKRSERGAGALTLSSNDFYTVAQLPALPEQIRNRPSVLYSCVISPETGYALALTHTDALIWPYNSSTSTPSSRDVVAFKLPFPPASATDPLPLATFTARSASGEPGIVAVSPKWGKVVYWDTLTNASSFLPGQTSSGVQGSVPGMLSGEIVQELVNAEPAGFILSFSHGRLAHLTVHDQMGRPGIGIRFLRKYSSTGAGLFGSIRNVFGGDRRKGTPIVKAGHATKGQRDVVVVTEDADLELWNTNLGVGDSLKQSVAFREELLESLAPLVPTTNRPPQIKVVDFELASHAAPEVARREDHHATPSMMLLVAVSVEDNTNYYIIETVIGATARVKVVHPIRCYSPSRSESPSWRPRLCLAKSQPVAFVLFETAVVLFSLAKIRESPSSQLLMERQALPEPFQDCIRFQEDSIYRVLGYAAEDHDEQAACVFGVQAFGMVKLTSHLREHEELDVDDFEDGITAKSKIEQAVFFGTIKQNPLDLSHATGQDFSAEDIESATLEISSEILSSTSKHLPKSAPSIDMQMKLRAKALDDLGQHVLQFHPSAISRNTRFQLLWDAEKLAAAQALWKVQEDIQRRYPLQDREMSYLDFTLRALHESRQKYPDPEKGEKDRVRHWLVHSAGNVDHLMSELVSCLPELEPMDVTDPRVVVDYLKEAVDLWNAAYTAAFKFREDRAPQYGLGDEVFQDGVLLSGYPVNLPHPWTSNPEPFRFGQRLIYDICKFLNEWWDFDASNKKKKKMPTDLDGKPYPAPEKGALKELAARLPTEVELFSRIVNEENIQAQCQIKAQEKDVEAQKQALEEIKAEKRPRINQAVAVISKFNMPGAIQLAEKLRDPGLLVTLNADYLRQLVLESAAHPDLAAHIEQKIVEVQNHAETYFDQFGNGWAYAHFSTMIEDGDLGSLLAKGQEDEKKQAYLTWFLKKSQKFGQKVGKISWINDVVGEDNYARAEKTLKHVADDESTDLWSKKTELSLAKLASLAAAGAPDRKDTAIYDHGLTLITIQEQIYVHIKAEVGDAVDEKAAQDLAMETFGTRVVAKMPALKRLLKAALKALLHQQPLSPEQLVDLLTLMDPVEWKGLPEQDPGVLGNEFFLALKVVDLSAPSADAKAALRAVVWRRAMIRDDWLILNETAGKDDRRVESDMQQSSLFRTIAQVLQETDVRLVSPSEILQQDVFPRGLQARFEENEVDGVRKDLDKEQAKLKNFVEKGRLEEHYGGLLASAARMVRAVADKKGEEMAEEAMADTET